MLTGKHEHLLQGRVATAVIPEGDRSARVKRERKAAMERRPDPETNGASQPRAAPLLCRLGLSAGRPGPYRQTGYRW